MAESSESKPGFFSRLFGRKGPETPVPAPDADKPDAARPAESPADETSSDALRQEEAAPAPASRSEGAPDYVTSAAAGEISPVAPTVTEASPDSEEKLPPELAGASLQPVEGFSPEATGPGEPVPRPAPEGVAPPDLPTSTPGVAKAPESPRAAPPLSSLPPSPPPSPAATPGVDREPESPKATKPAAPEPAEPAPAAAPEGERPSWWRRLTSGMRRTSSSLSEGVTGLFTKRKLDATTLEDLEDILVRADLGVETATRITEAVGKGRYNREIAADEVKAIMAAEVERVLEPVAKPLEVDRSRKPFVILVVGVNGAGKTTTIGKLGLKFKEQGLKVMLAAGDTFRAAAIEQLKVWGERTGTPVITRPQGSDAAGLAFDALKEAQGNGTDVLMVDTAGRLQNKAGLMAELEKIVRVMKKLDESAPHATLLVLDATVGQNAVNQVDIFRQAAGVSGLVMTKLDGTARGGILVALAARFGLPVHFIGVGEGVEDLEPFAARDFARAIAGLEEA